MCRWTVRRDTKIWWSRLHIIQIPWTLNWIQQLDNNLDLTLWGSWWLHSLCLSWILGSKGEDCARNSCLPISILSFFPSVSHLADDFGYLEKTYTMSSWTLSKNRRRSNIFQLNPWGQKNTRTKYFFSKSKYFNKNKTTD